MSDEILVPILRTLKMKGYFKGTTQEQIKQVRKFKEKYYNDQFSKSHKKALEEKYGVNFREDTNE